MASRFRIGSWRCGAACGVLGSGLRLGERDVEDPQSGVRGQQGAAAEDQGRQRRTAIHPGRSRWPAGRSAGSGGRSARWPGPGPVRSSEALPRATTFVHSSDACRPISLARRPTTTEGHRADAEDGQSGVVEVEQGGGDDGEDTAEDQRGHDHPRQPCGFAPQQPQLQGRHCPAPVPGQSPGEAARSGSPERLRPDGRTVLSEHRSGDDPGPRPGTQGRSPPTNRPTRPARCRSGPDPLPPSRPLARPGGIHCMTEEPVLRRRQARHTGLAARRRAPRHRREGERQQQHQIPSVTLPGQQVGTRSQTS